MSEVDKFNNDKLNSLSKEVLLTLACYDLGGAKKKIHSEEIAYRVFRWKPSAFSWSLEKYKRYPDKESARRPLLNARDNEKFITGAYARELSKDGWMLTPKGVDKCKELLHLINLKKNKSSIQANEKKSLNNIKKNIKFKKFIADGTIEEFTEYDLADILNIRLDSIETLRDNFFKIKLMSKEFDNDLFKFFAFIQKILNTSLNEDDFNEQQKAKKRAKHKIKKEVFKI